MAVGRHRARAPRLVVALAAVLSTVATTGGLTVAGLTATGGRAQASTPLVVDAAVTDVNPDNSTRALFGGRIESLALHPVDQRVMFAASELGGFWVTRDAAATWRHLSEISVFRAWEVAIADSDPDLVVAVGRYDGRSRPGRGGVWLSRDGGRTWEHARGADPGGSCSAEFNAYAVAFGPGTPGNVPVFIGHDCGVARSTDSGRTWTRLDPDGSFDNGLGQGHPIEDLLVRPGGGSSLEVDACGQQGFFRSTDSGATWTAADAASPTFRPATSTGVGGGAFGPCRIATAPGDDDVVHLANFEGGTASGFCAGQLLVSNQGGAPGTWTQMGPDVTDYNCRTPFVQTRQDADGDPTTYHTYFGTSTRVLRQTCDTDATPACTAGAASWPRWDTNTNHADPTNIAFDPRSVSGCPRYLANDGGVARLTSDGCAAAPSFASANTGLHALDVSQMAGTVWPTHTDIYFGTQDNGTFYTGDGGATYANDGPDGYEVNADLRGNPGASLLRRDCFGCGVSRRGPGTPAGPAMGGPLGFGSPPGADWPNRYVLAQFGPGSYVAVTPDNTDASGLPQTWRPYVTLDAGTSWTQFGDALPGAPFPGGFSGPAQSGAVQAAGPADSPVFYLNLGRQLSRLTGILPTAPAPASTAATLTPISTGLTDVRLFAADPGDPTRLYAVSVGGAQGVFRSTNAGASWVLDTELTSLVTGGGTHEFFSGWGEQVTGIGFDPWSDTVLVGTRSNGVFASVNGGDDWVYVRGSRERLTWARDFLFDDVRGTAYAASRGHGLWRIDLPKADLAVTVTDAPDPVTAGEQLTYSVRVANAGPAVASATTASLVLDPRLSYVGSSTPCTATEGGSSGDTVRCPVRDLAAGDSTTFTVTAHVAHDALTGAGSSTAVTTASVRSTETIDPGPADDTARVPTLLAERADLQTTQLCDPATVEAGRPANCTVFLDNHGPSAARGVVASATLLSPGSFEVSGVTPSTGGSCTETTVPGGRRIDCTWSRLDAESTARAGRHTLAYTLRAAEGQEVDSKARVRSDTPDPDDTNNITDTTVTVTSVADLALRAVAPASAVAGTSHDYVLDVRNHGPSTARNVLVEATVPAGVAIESVTAPGATSCTTGVPGDPLQPTRCAFGSLPPDADSGSPTVRTVTLRLAVSPDQLADLAYDARVSSDVLDPDNSDDLAGTATALLTAADLSVTSSAAPDGVVAGRPITYTLDVRNTGPSTARQVALTEELPGFVDLVGTTVQRGTGTCALVTSLPRPVVTCELSDLRPGDHTVVVVNGTVRPAAPAGSDLVGRATVATATADTNTGNDTATSTTPVSRVSDLSVVLTSDSPVYKPSTTIHYVITVANAGPSDAADTVVQQELPPTTYGRYISDDGGCTLSGTTLSCPAVTLPAGASRVVQVKWHVQGSKGTISSTATTTSASTDPNTADNSSTWTVTRK